MKLEKLMNLRGFLRMPLTDLGDTPLGRRIVADVESGEFSGARLRGTLLQSGADWLLVDNRGIGRLDVRICLRTDDGALIYSHYHGFIELNDVVFKALLEGGETCFGEFRFLTAPRFECSDPRYEWLNSMLAVAEGRVIPGHGVEYRVYEVCPGHDGSAAVDPDAQ